MSAPILQLSGFFPRAFTPLNLWIWQKLEDSCLEADAALHSWKARLFGNARGVVLEIGAGTGINRKYLGYPVTYLGLEPEPNAYLQLNAIADTAFCAVAESIPLPAESVDCIVCSMTLCSVKDLSLTLNEVYRVLRPDGRFLLIEHVGAPKATWLRSFQRLFRPACQCLDRGCRPDRDTAEALRSCRLVMEDFTEFQLKLRGPLIRDWITACLIKPEAS